MKTLDRQMLDVVNQTRSNPESFRGWRGQFTPEFKLLEFDGFGNCGEFATIKARAGKANSVLIPSNSTGLETSPTEP